MNRSSDVAHPSRNQGEEEISISRIITMLNKPSTITVVIVVFELQLLLFLLIMCHLEGCWHGAGQGVLQLRGAPNEESPQVRNAGSPSRSPAVDVHAEHTWGSHCMYLICLCTKTHLHLTRSPHIYLFSVRLLKTVLL